MRPGREVDARIAKEVFGYNVWAKAKVLYENAPTGERPLRNYSKEMEWAWEVAKHMKVTLLPIVDGLWFAFIGPVAIQGWSSPQALLEFLASGKFNDCGAAVGADAPAVICEAALKAAEKRRQAADQTHIPLSEVTAEQVASAHPHLGLVEASPNPGETH